MLVRFAFVGTFVLLSVSFQFDATDTGEFQVNQTERRITLQMNEIKDKFNSNIGSFKAFLESEMELLKCKLKEFDLCPSKGTRECPSGWLHKGGRCFTVILEQQSDWSWFKALQTCASMNATLMELETAEELIYLANVGITNKKQLWLGGTDWFKEGSWIWMSGNSVTFKWGKGEPNGGTSQNCLGMYFSDPHNVHDFPCDGNQYKNAPVCKKNFC